MPDKPKPVTDKQLREWAEPCIDPYFHEPPAMKHRQQLAVFLLSSRAEVGARNCLIAKQARAYVRQSAEVERLKEEVRQADSLSGLTIDKFEKSVNRNLELRNQLAAADAFKLKIFKASCSSKPDESWRMILAALEEDDDTRKEATPCKTTSTAS